MTTEEKVLELAKRLAIKRIFSTEGRFNRKLKFWREEDEWLKFAIEFNTEWDNDEMADLVAEAFNDFGFEARTYDNCGYVWVKVEPFGNPLKNDVNEVFRKYLGENPLHYP